jgi:hypothetical protein
VASRSRATADAQPSPAEAEASDSQQHDGSPHGKANGRAASSRASSAAADPFFRDPGPGFDAEQAAEAAAEAPVADEPPDIVLWTPERVRRVLELQGQLTHAVVGVAEQDWVWLPRELDMVCGPLADHCNRVPALAALAQLSDDAAIAAGFVSYAMRSWLERTRELQRRKAAQPTARPVTDRAPAPEVVDPEEVSWETPAS